MGVLNDGPEEMKVWWDDYEYVVWKKASWPDKYNVCLHWAVQACMPLGLIPLCVRACSRVHVGVQGASPCGRERRLR